MKESSTHVEPGFEHIYILSVYISCKKIHLIIQLYPLKNFKKKILTAQISNSAPFTGAKNIASGPSPEESLFF